MNNPLATIASGDLIGVKVEFIGDKLDSIKLSMNIPMDAILKSYGQPDFFTYFQYGYYAIYLKPQFYLTFRENLSENDERYVVQIMLGTDDFISQYHSNSIYLPAEKCTGNNPICTTIQTATPYPKS